MPESHCNLAELFTHNVPHFLKQVGLHDTGPINARHAGILPSSLLKTAGAFTAKDYAPVDFTLTSTTQPLGRWCCNLEPLINTEDWKGYMGKPRQMSNARIRAFLASLDGQWGAQAKALQSATERFWRCARDGLSMCLVKVDQKAPSTDNAVLQYTVTGNCAKYMHDMYCAHCHAVLAHICEATATQLEAQLTNLPGISKQSGGWRRKGAYKPPKPRWGLPKGDSVKQGEQKMTSLHGAAEAGDDLHAAETEDGSQASSGVAGRWHNLQSGAKRSRRKKTPYSPP